MFGSFSLSVLEPVVVLILISAIIPVVLSIFKLKFIPVFVLEIVSGMIIGAFFNKSGMFSNSLMTGLYTIGMAFLLFLSGLDTDFSVIKKTRKGDGININAFNVSIKLLLSVIVLSFLCSFIFINYIEKNHLFEGIFLLTIALSSTFASVIIPIIHQDHLAKTTAGQIICTYATLSELLSILGLSFFMIFNEINHDQKPWLLIIVLIILVIIYIIKRFFNFERFNKAMDGVVHLGLRCIILVFLTLIIVTEEAGAEYILGAFLAGMVIKAARVSHHTIEKIEVVGYGIFVPMFYILVGVHIPIIELFSDYKNVLLIIGLVCVLLLTKVPFLSMFKWYNKNTTIPSMFLVTCTVIVAIALEHFHVFNETFISCLIIASSITCVIPPILFEINKKFGNCKPKYEGIILEPHEVIED